MRMLGTGIHEKFFIHLAAQAVLREHTFYGALDNGVGTALEKILGDLLLLAAGVAAEVHVDLVFQLVTGENDLVGIDDDDEIAAVDVGGVVGFVLAAQDGSDLGTHAANGLISTVHNIPVAFNGSLVRMLGGEMQFAHFLCFLRLPALSHRLCLFERSAKVDLIGVMFQEKTG